jgi:hypothetical protein
MDKKKKTLRPLSSFPDFNEYLEDEYDPGEPSDSDLAEMDDEDEDDEGDVPREQSNVWSFDHDWSPDQERDWMESRYVTDEGDRVVDRLWRGEDE